MKTLDEIKDEVSLEVTLFKFNEMGESAQNAMWPEICNRAQLEACKATLEKVVKNVNYFIGHDGGFEINKYSITDESNITLL